MRRLILLGLLVGTAGCIAARSAAPARPSSAVHSPYVVPRSEPHVEEGGDPGGDPPTASVPPHDSIEDVGALKAELDEIFSDPGLEHALWAVVVQSVDNGELLFQLNAGKLMMPASNMKIVTLAVVAEKLGWDYRFETRLEAAGQVESGRLAGDLYVVGTGDPTIVDRPDAPRPFDVWADQLRASGITAIDGRIIGDDDAFEDQGLGAGWSWDYLAYGYAAPSGALQFNEDSVEVTVRAAQRAGDPVTVQISPGGSGLTVANRLTTTPVSGPFTVDLRRLPGSAVLELVGSIPAATPAFTRTASVANPTEFFARALRSALIAKGITVSGDAVDIDALPPATLPRRVLLRHQSPPLAEIAIPLMKLSQNLYADTLLKALSAKPEIGSAEAGRKVVAEVLEDWGIPQSDYVMYDGSGLSRYNYVTADMLVKVLRRLYQDPRHRAPFLATLPIAGSDGTFAKRLKGTKAEGNARAKTGSLSNVRALSGYVTSADGETLAFSVLANHFNVPQATIDGVTDLVVERLANFRRRNTQ